MNTHRLNRVCTQYPHLTESGDSVTEDQDFSLRFDASTKTRLKRKLSSSITLREPFSRDCDIEFEVNVIIKIMEGLAESIPAVERMKPEKHQRRQERINSLASHLDGIIEQIKALDTPALTYVLHSAGEEATGSDQDHSLMAYYAETLKDSDEIRELKAFSLGLRKASKELPKHSLNQSGKNLPWYALGAELGTALALEKLFFENGIKFTTSNTGLAGECLSAIYTLGGLNIDRVDYWLKQAKDHHDSMTSIMKRSQKSHEE